MRKVIPMVLLGGLVAAALIVRSRQQSAAGAQTAGDIESNVISDAADKMMNLVKNMPSGAEPYRQVIYDSAAAHGVPPSILAWLLWKESRYNPKIISGEKRSPVGALGIAQFMPATAREWLGSEAAALDPEQAIPGAARYLKWLRDRTDSWAEALAAYNWGIGNVQRKGIERAPAETRDYFSTIMAAANAGGGTYA